MPSMYITNQNKYILIIIISIVFLYFSCHTNTSTLSKKILDTLFRRSVLDCYVFVCRTSTRGFPFVGSFSWQAVRPAFFPPYVSLRLLESLPGGCCSALPINAIKTCLSSIPRPPPSSHNFSLRNTTTKISSRSSLSGTAVLSSQLTLWFLLPRRVSAFWTRPRVFHTCVRCSPIKLGSKSVFPDWSNFSRFLFCHSTTYYSRWRRKLSAETSAKYLARRFLIVPSITGERERLAGWCYVVQREGVRGRERGVGGGK